MMREDWSLVRLSEVADQRTETTVPVEADPRPYVALEHLAQGSPILLGWSAAGRAGSAKTVFHGGDVLFGKLRPYLRKAAPAPFDGLCSTDILALFTRESLDAGYLSQLVHWHPLQRHAVATSSGTKMPRTSWAQLGRFEFLLPPLPEQRKIVAILSSVDNAIEKTQAVIDQVQVVKRGLMQELLTRGLPGRHRRFKQTEIGKIPMDWRVVRLSDVTTHITDGVHKTPEYVDTGIPFLSVNNLRDGRLDFSNCRFVSEDTHQRLVKRCCPEPGDLLMGKVATLGVVDVVKSIQPFSIFVQLALIRPTRAAHSSFLKWIIRGDHCQRRIGEAASGTGMKYIGIGQISQLSLPLPSIDEQEGISARLDALETRIDTETTAKDGLLDLKSSLVSILLTGQLRAPLDGDAG